MDWSWIEWWHPVPLRLGKYKMATSWIWAFIRTHMYILYINIEQKTSFNLNWIFRIQLLVGMGEMWGSCFIFKWNGIEYKMIDDRVNERVWPPYYLTSTSDQQTKCMMWHQWAGDGVDKLKTVEFCTHFFYPKRLASNVMELLIIRSRYRCYINYMQMASRKSVL